MKRIAVNYRDVDTLPKLVDYEVSRGALASKQARLAAKPSLTKRDLKLLMYGTAAYSEKEFKDRGLTGSDCGGPVGGSFSMKNGQPRGGMMWDGLRDWPHNVGGVKRLDDLFGKRWRTLGKGGSSGATNKEAVIGYICLPKIVKKGKLIFLVGKWSYIYTLKIEQDLVTTLLTYTGRQNPLLIKWYLG